MTENNGKKRKFLTTVGMLSVGSVLTALAIFVFISFAGREGIIRTDDSRYFRANNILLIGNFVIILRAGESFDSRDKSLGSDSPPLNPGFYRIGNLSAIEFNFAAEEKKNGLNQGSSDKWSMSLKDYIGEYKINAAGNNGYLFLGVKGGVVYGSVRFPNWGRGVIEPLKNVRIANGAIWFTRSAVSSAEMKALGITAPFVQEYQGSYVHSGNKIKGTYSVQNVKKDWEAIRSK